jgi:hypothetical protein
LITKKKKAFFGSKFQNSSFFEEGSGKKVPSKFRVRRQVQT